MLQGKCDPLESLFPEGDLTTASAVYQDSPGAKVMNSLLQKVLTLAVEQQACPELSRRMRVLELGAGTGGSTSYLLNAVKELVLGHREGAEYGFSDISPLFLAKAQEKFRDDDIILIAGFSFFARIAFDV